MSKRKIPQHELPVVGAVFNLAGEVGQDPWRLEREYWAKSKAEEEGRAFQAKMQRTMEGVPGLRRRRCSAWSWGGGSDCH